MNEDGRDAAQGAKLGAAGAPPVDRSLSRFGIPNGEKGGLFCPAMGRKKNSRADFISKRIWVEIDPKHF